MSDNKEKKDPTRTSVSLPEAIHHRLKMEAAKRKLKVQELVTQILDAGLPPAPAIDAKRKRA